MATLQLEERLSELKGKPVSEQVSGALSIILQSVNGEAPHVFDFFGQSPAAVQLAGKIDRSTGLMLPVYFKQSVARRFAEADYVFDTQKRSVEQTYVLVSTDDVAGLKAFLKSNGVAPTEVIGVYALGLDNVTVAALLPCDKRMAKSVLSKAEKPFSFEDNGVVDHSGVPFVAGYARYVPFADFDSIHADAAGDLMHERELRDLRADVALALVEGRDFDCTKYFALKNKYQK